MTKQLDELEKLPFIWSSRRAVMAFKERCCCSAVAVLLAPAEHNLSATSDERLDLTMTHFEFGGTRRKAPHRSCIAGHVVPAQRHRQSYYCCARAGSDLRFVASYDGLITLRRVQGSGWLWEGAPSMMVTAAKASQSASVSSVHSPTQQASICSAAAFITASTDAGAYPEPGA
eukprot:1074382-Pyramimonas_sp.AAC.1